MVQVKDMLGIWKKFCSHVCDPRSPIAENDGLLVRTIAVFDCTTVQVTAEFTGCAYIGNILFFLYTVLAYALFILPPVDMIG